ncbi:MAG: hypothetical protein PVF87_04435 [Acidimicrobiia bacterium]|jgi:hypothetical protein
MTSRFIDEGHPIYEFINSPIEVQCPRCGERATLKHWGEGEPALHSPRRLACPACGHVEDHDGTVLQFSPDGHDPCFGHLLWYRAETSKGVIWAYNREQLEALRSFIGASLRERSAAPTWKNRSYFSRLPKWMKSAKNREWLKGEIDSMLSRRAKSHPL